MSTYLERVVVLMALARAEGSGSSLGREVLPSEVARNTGEFTTRTASGSRVSYGERRVLAELVDDGLVRRRRSWSFGHTFKLTDEGRGGLP